MEKPALHQPALSDEILRWPGLYCMIFMNTVSVIFQSIR
jgi:hypothetical protein